MKKYVAVFLAGALLMLSTQVLADTVSQIGKKVDSEASVYVDGVKVSDAIIIKGKSYVPGRDVAEALGAKVEWKGSEGVVITSEIDKLLAEKEERNALMWEIADLKSIISGAERSIERAQNIINKYQEELASTTNEMNKQFLTGEIEKFTREIEENKTKLERAEKELKELESAK